VNPDPVLLTVARWILVAAAAVATLFPLVYLRSPWFRSWLGVGLMVQSVAVAALLDLSVVNNFFKEWFGPEDRVTLLWIQLFLITAIGAANTILLVVLFTLQQRRRGKHSNDTHRALEPPGDLV